MRNSFVSLMMAIGLAIAATPAPASEDEGIEAIPLNKVTVSRESDQWIARFEFAEESPIWGFHRSQPTRENKVPWRPLSWRIITDGVVLTRIGNFDVLIAEDGTLPEEVDIEFTPVSVDLLGDYDPAIVFSTGEVAIFGGHFTAFPAASAFEIATLRAPKGWPNAVSFAPVGEPYIFDGQEVDTIEDASGGYAFVGGADIDPDAPVATILDPGMPSWLSKELSLFTEQVFGHYGQRLGEHAGQKPTVLASWHGGEREGYSTGGSVSSGMISMRLEGQALLEPSEEALGWMRWFIAHEAAHFWLGNTIAYETAGDAWITEGGADLLASLTTIELGGGDDRSDRLQRSVEHCGDYLETAPLNEAHLTNNNLAFYSCGFVLSLAVELADEGDGYESFVTRIINSEADGMISQEEWLVHAREHGVDEEMHAQMGTALAGGLEGKGALESIGGKLKEKLAD